VFYRKALKKLRKQFLAYPFSKLLKPIDLVGKYGYTTINLVSQWVKDRKSVKK
jgi:hypothetical protein